MKGKYWESVIICSLVLLFFCAVISEIVKHKNQVLLKEKQQVIFDRCKKHKICTFTHEELQEILVLKE